MHNLTNIQNTLTNTLLGGNDSLHFIKQNGAISTKDRLDIHVSTIFVNYVSSLKITYPGIWKLIGEECARGVALAYSHDRVNLTSRSKIAEFGDNFPQFIQNFPSIQHLQYLSDFAHLELLRSKSYGAIAQKSMSISELQPYFESGIESCKLIFNNSVLFFQSNYPLSNIQDLLDNPDSDELSVDKQRNYIIVCRTAGKVETLFLKQKTWEFMYRLSQGDTMEQSMAVFTEKELLIETQAIIHLILNKQMIIKIME